MTTLDPEYKLLRPADAESVELEPCLTVARAPSRLMPGQMTFQTTFTCPNCKRARGRPEHFRAFVCEGCGLALMLDYDRLHVWRVNPVPA